jgi:hypothetical protein
VEIERVRWRPGHPRRDERPLGSRRPRWDAYGRTLPRSPYENIRGVWAGQIIIMFMLPRKEKQ